jgi:hypothetical protein
LAYREFANRLVDDRLSPHARTRRDLARPARSRSIHARSVSLPGDAVPQFQHSSKFTPFNSKLAAQIQGLASAHCGRAQRSWTILVERLGLELPRRLRMRGPAVPTVV